MTKYYDRILKLAKYDGITLFGYACIVWVVEQIVSRMVENIIWGEHFSHWFDVGFTLALFALYALTATELADRISLVKAGENLDQSKDTPQ